MNNSKLISVDEAMTRLHISRSSIYRLMNEQKLLAKKVGRRTMFTNDAITTYINTLNDYKGGCCVY